jgi:hypothetical protein
MDPILLSDTYDEAAMSQQTKRRGIAKKRNSGELLQMFSRRKKLMTLPRRNQQEDPIDHKSPIDQLRFMLSRFKCSQYGAILNIICLSHACNVAGMQLNDGDVPLAAKFISRWSNLSQLHRSFHCVNNGSIRS